MFPQAFPIDRVICFVSRKPPVSVDATGCATLAAHDAVKTGNAQATIEVSTATLVVLDKPYWEEGKAAGDKKLMGATPLTRLWCARAPRV